jgi:hypothetical protein
LGSFFFFQRFYFFPIFFKRIKRGKGILRGMASSNKNKEKKK